MPEENIGLIQGRVPGSAEEWRVSQALDQLKHRYIYQYQVFAVAGAKGTYYVDFLITSTVPNSTALEVFGEYWHEGQLGSDDRFRLSMIEGELGPVKIVWGKDLGTVGEAKSKLIEEIGRG